MDEYGLRNLKEDYRDIQEKYKLPSFKEMNEDFSIEKISDSETEILIREVRRHVSDKLANYLRFVETLLNPSNVQMFVYSVIKSLSSEDKEKLKEIYKILSKKELDLIELDLDFSEQKEADFIKSSFESWVEIKKDLLRIVGNAKDNFDVKQETKTKDYFG